MRHLQIVQAGSDLELPSFRHATASMFTNRLTRNPLQSNPVSGQLNDGP
jgi:hypothetical protein